MPYGKEPVNELWAVLDASGAILYSRGGSSSTPKLMVYPTEKKAEGALKSPWIKQVIDRNEVTVKCIYKAPKSNCEHPELVDCSVCPDKETCEDLSALVK